MMTGIPATSAQSAMLYQQFVDPTSVGNNLVAAGWVAGRATPAQVRLAWRETTRAHPALSRRVDLDDRGFVWRDAAPSDDAAAEVASVTSVMDDTVRGDLSRWARRPFAVLDGTLCRLAARCDGTRVVVAVCTHHALLDVISARLVLHSFFARLRALETGEREPDPIGPDATRHVLAAERGYLASPEADADRSYWRTLLADLSADPVSVLQRRGGDQRPPSPHDAHWVRLEIDTDAARAVRDRATAVGASSSAAMLAVWGRTLAASTGDDDVSVGVPVLRRDSVTENSLGCLTQTAVVRARVGSDLDGDIAAMAVGLRRARAHGRLPISEILRSAPLADPVRTAFLYEPSHIGYGGAYVLGDEFVLPMAGYGFRPYPLPAQIGQFPIRFQASALHGRFLCAIHVDGTSIGRDTATEVANEAATQVRHLTGGVGRVTVGDGDRSVFGWVHPAPRSPDPRRDAAVDVVERITRRVRRAPSDVAVRRGAAAVTYRRLWDHAGAVACYLDDRGVPSGPDPVAVVASRTPAAVAAILGVLRSGRAFVVVDPDYPDHRRAVMLQTVAAVVLDDTTLARLDPGHERVGADVPGSVSVHHDAPAYVVFTSGSTGVPKRVLVPRGALALSTAARDVVHPERPARFLHLSSLSFDSAYAGLFWTLAVGGELILGDALAAGGTPDVLAAIREHSATHLLAVPSLYGALLVDDDGALRGLREVIVAGEACSDALRDGHRSSVPGVAMVNEYGPSEATIWATAHRVDDHDEPVTIGTPVPGVEALVLGAGLREVPDDHVGVLHLGGMLAHGYLGDARATASAFIPHPGGHGARLYATGDRVRRDASGRLTFLGRGDDQVKVHGHRVEPGDVEEAVRRVAGAESVVTVRGGGLVVLVDRATAARVDAAALRGSLAAELPAFMVPDAVLVTGELPRGVTGKLDRRAARREAADAVAMPERGEVHCSPAAPDDAGAAAVRDAVLAVLGPDVDLGLSFVAAGGDSISAMRVIGRLTTRDWQLTPQQLLDASSVDAVSATRGPTPRAMRRDREAATTSRATGAAQRAMLLRTAAAPSSGVYVEQLVMDITGPVDRERLADAWRTVFAAHPFLGARPEADASRLVVDPSSPPTVTAVPWSASAADRTDWPRWLEDDRRAGFRMAVGDDAEGAEPLSRVRVMPGPSGTRCVWTHHHAVADGWSLPIVLADLCAAYRGEAVAGVEGVAPDLPSAPVVESDEAVSTPGASMIPSSVAPDVTDTGPITLAVAGADRLEAMSAALGVTLGAAVNTAWSITLATAFGVDRPRHGTVVSGRDLSLPGVDRAVGLFIRVVPIAVTVPDRIDGVATTGGGVAGAVAAALARAMDPSAPPVDVTGIDSIVVVENYPMDPSLLDLGDWVSVAAVDLTERTEYPLSLQYRSWPEARCELHVDPTRCPRDLASVLAETFGRVVAALAADPTAPLRSTRTDGLEPTSRRAVADLDRRLRSLADAEPGARAVVAGDDVLDRAALQRRIAAAATALATADVGVGDVVAVWAHPKVEVVSVLLAAHRLGAAWVVLEPDLPADRCDHVRRSAGVTVDASPTTDSMRVVRVAGVETGRGAGVAYVIHTSGTTGVPKAIAVGRAELAGHLDDIATRFGHRPDDVVAVFGSLSFDASLEQVLGALWAGASAVVRPRDLVEPRAVAGFLEDAGVTVFNPPTGYWLQFGRDVAAAAVPSVRTVIVGGEALPSWATREWAAVRMVNAYGPTEAVVTALAHTVAVEDGAGTGSVPIGVPHGPRTATVMGRDDRPVAAGVPGEVWLGGGRLAIGYLGDPRGTASAFVPDPAATAPGARAFRTGDLARSDEAGTLVHLGRADRQLKVRGHRVDPDEIERAAVDHAGVRAARAIGVGSPTRVVCAVVEPGGQPDRPAAVRAVLAEQLPSWLVPSQVLVVDALPLTRTGKVDDRALAAAATTAAVSDGAGATDVAHGDDLSSAREAVAEAFGAVTGCHDPATGFLSAGGDSLRALELVARVRRAGVVIESRVLLADATVDEIVASAVLDPSATATGAQPTVSRLLPPSVWWFRDRVSPTGVPERWDMAVRIDLDTGPRADDIDAALSAVVAAHPMLRSRLDTTGDHWELHVTEEPPVTDHLTLAAGTSRDQAVTQLFAGLQNRIGITTGRPVGLGSARVEGDPGSTLVLVVHHLVTDVVSLQIIVEDLLDCLTATARGERPSVAPEATSVHEWVSWLTRTATPEDGRVLLDALHRGVDTQACLTLDPGTERDAAVAVVDIDLTIVRAAAETMTATVDEVLQIAAVRAVRELCPGPGAVGLEIETHGRELEVAGLDLSRTVGWFTGLFVVPIGPGTPTEQLSELRGRRRVVGRSGQSAAAARHLSRVDGAWSVPAVVGVNFVGKVDTVGGAAVSPIGIGHLRAPEVARPVAVAVDAWTLGDGVAASMRISVESAAADGARRVADAVLAAIHAMTAVGGVPRDLVTTGHCRIDLRDNPIETLTDTHGRLFAVAPLTPMQEAMFLRTLADGDGGAYVEQNVVALPQGVDATRLAAAVDGLAAWYPLLRGAVAWGLVGDPVLVVPEVGARPVARVRRDVSATDATREALRDLTRAGGDVLFDAVVLSDADRAHTLILTFHHLVLDGWSMGLVVERLRAVLDGEAAGAPDLHMLATMVSSRADRRRHGPVPTATDVRVLPDLPSADMRPTGNLDVTDRLGPERSRMLRRVAAATGATPAAVAHAVWVLLLSGAPRRAPSGTVRIGSVASRRPTTASAAPGMFLEDLTLDVDLDRCPTPTALVGAVHAALRDGPGAYGPVTAHSRGGYRTAVVVDDGRGAGAVTMLLGAPVEIIDTRERTGLPLTFSVGDLDSDLEVALNCQLDVVTESAGRDLLTDLADLVEAIDRAGGTAGLATVVVASASVVADGNTSEYTGGPR